MLKDKDLREPLFEFLEMTFGKVRIIEEKRMGKSRADIVMVTESALFGVEIKSDPDTYDRLDRQVKDYDRFFEYNIIAVGTKHANSIEEHVPDWWGIITIEEVGDSVDCLYFRKAKQNPKAVKKPEYCLPLQMGFLWRNELEHILTSLHMRTYTSKSKKQICEIIMAHTEPSELKHMLSRELFERDYTRFEEKENTLPFTVYRSRRKTIAIEINDNLELIVRAPFRAKDEVIKGFVDSNAELIDRNCEKVKKKIEAYKAELGAVGMLTEDDIKELTKKARKYIPDRVAFYASLLGTDYGRIAVRNQTTRWGSCSGKKNMNFNCLLMLTPPEIIDYVIVHEVCHLKYMNHKKEFWELVEKFIPDYKKRRKWLMDHGAVIMGRVPKSR